MELNSNQIAEILPHRYPFALVDRIVDGEPGKWAKGIKCVTVNEPFFQGHFPQKHVMPGVLLIEAMAQVGGVTLLYPEENRGKIAVFGKIDKVRFRRPVRPGDTLVTVAQNMRVMSRLGIFALKGYVGDELAAEAEVKCVLSTQDKLTA